MVSASSSANISTICLASWAEMSGTSAMESITDFPLAPLPSLAVAKAAETSMSSRRSSLAASSLAARSMAASTTAVALSSVVSSSMPTRVASLAVEPMQFSARHLYVPKTQASAEEPLLNT